MIILHCFVQNDTKCFTIVGQNMNKYDTLQLCNLIIVINIQVSLRDKSAVVEYTSLPNFSVFTICKVISDLGFDTFPKSDSPMHGTLTLTIHYTLYTIHFTIYNIHYTLYTIHYTLTIFRD